MAEPGRDHVDRDTGQQQCGGVNVPQVVTFQEMTIRQLSDRMQITSTSRGNVTVEEGGYLWDGEMRLWDNEVLMGWYVATDGGVRSKGTLFFVVHPHGVNMTGRWVGLSYDGPIVTGWGTIARTEDEARSLMDQLRGKESRAPA